MAGDDSALRDPNAEYTTRDRFSETMEVTAERAPGARALEFHSSTSRPAVRDRLTAVGVILSAITT
jgi:hypothetical protein